MFENFKYSILSQDYIFIIGLIIMWSSSIIIFSSVFFKFIEYKIFKKEKIIKKEHIVETISMAAIIVIILNILQMNLWIYKIDEITRILCLIIGSFFILLSLWMHIKSKFEIGKYWSNQIEILDNHKIITTGVYSFVRHPMYSSLIIWLLALDIIFLNYIVLLIIIILFIPMICIRANAEDKILKNVDEISYKLYSEKVKQLIPKFDGTISIFLRIFVILFLGYLLILHNMNIERFVLLFLLHFITGLIIGVPKISFSYINKSFIMLIIFVFFFTFTIYFLFFLYYFNF